MKYFIDELEVSLDTFDYEFNDCGEIELVSAMFIDNEAFDGLGDYLDDEQLEAIIDIYGLPEEAYNIEMNESEALTLWERNK